MEQAGTQLQDILTAMAAILKDQNAEQQKMFLEAIKEMKKPSPEEQAKLDREREQTTRRAKEQAELARIEHQRREANKLGCPHGTTHPGTGVFKHAWRAQVHTPAGRPPYFVPICMQCLTELQPIPATAEMLTNGVNLDQYRSLDMAQLVKWAESAKTQVA